MNWKEIKKKYPKAWILLKEWFGYKKNITINMELSKIFMPERKLYDFFDKQKIIIEIGIGYNFNENKYILNEWSYDIIDCDIENEGQYNSRLEAEEVAFLKAFEILENKLKT